jgi:hypothetical protein
MPNQELELIAISVVKMKRIPFTGPSGNLCQSAVIRGRSSVRDLSFEIETGPLAPEQIAACEALMLHGSTVVAAPLGWRNSWPPDSWQDTVIIQAGNRVKGISEANLGAELMQGYDRKLADAILKILDRVFPKSLSRTELKYELASEPSDDQLLISLDALLIDGHITGKPLRGGAGNKLVEIMNIGLTGDGRRHLAKLATHTTETGGHVVHGDQIINYGQAGAIGRNASGSINFSEKWNQVETGADLESLAKELAAIRTELRNTASSRSDDKTLAYLAEAEEMAEAGDGGQMLAALSKVGKNALTIAKDIGTDVAAKFLAIASGLA